MSYELQLKSLEPATLLLASGSKPTQSYSGCCVHIYIVSNSTRARANQCDFCNPILYTLYTSFSGDGAWLSKQLKNGSSRSRTSEAADRDKNAYPDGGLQIGENPLEREELY